MHILVIGSSATSLGSVYVYTDTIFHQLYERIGERSYLTSLAEEGKSYGC